MKQLALTQSGAPGCVTGLTIFSHFKWSCNFHSYFFSCRVDFGRQVTQVNKTDGISLSRDLLYSLVTNQASFG